jgi:hypothetical protein
MSERAEIALTRSPGFHAGPLSLASSTLGSTTAGGTVNFLADYFLIIVWSNRV